MHKLNYELVFINYKFTLLLNMFLAIPINRPLIIGQIVGAQSTLDDSFYRGKVLNKIDDITYSIQFIDFGDMDNVPLSKIFEIPADFMVMYTLIIKVNYKLTLFNLLFRFLLL